MSLLIFVVTLDRECNSGGARVSIQTCSVSRKIGPASRWCTTDAQQMYNGCTMDVIRQFLVRSRLIDPNQQPHHTIFSRVMYSRKVGGLNALKYLMGRYCNLVDSSLDLVEARL